MGKWYMGEEDRIAIARLEEKVTHWMETTTEYRVSLCNKIDKLFQKFESLPCKERSEIYKGLAVREKLIWGAIGVVATLLFIHLGYR